MSTIDLNNTGGKGKLEWTSAETDAEMAVRLRQEELEANHDRAVRWWTFVAFLLALLIVGVAGLALMFIGGPPERERVGTVILTSIVSGAVGFLSGRAGKALK